MIIYLILTAISIFLVGLAKGISDTLQFHYVHSVYKNFNPLWWNPAISWKNKYKNWDEGDKTPRFPLSTTWLVTFTDAWHTFQFIQNIAICLTAIFMALAALHSPLDASGFITTGRDSISTLFVILAAISLRIILQLGFVIGYK